MYTGLEREEVFLEELVLYFFKGRDSKYSYDESDPCAVDEEGDDGVGSDVNQNKVTGYFTQILALVYLHGQSNTYGSFQASKGGEYYLFQIETLPKITKVLDEYDNREEASDDCEKVDVE